MVVVVMVVYSIRTIVVEVVGTNEAELVAGTTFMVMARPFEEGITNSFEVLEV
jgi:hypothetical protein